MWILFALACVANTEDAVNAEVRADSVDSGAGAALPELLVGPELACDAPAEAPSWTDVAAERGMLPGRDSTATHGAGGYAAVGEFDGKPGFDIAIDHVAELQLYTVNGPAYFAAMAVAGTESARLTSVDLDGDGIDELLRGDKDLTEWRLDGTTLASSALVTGLADGPAHPANGLFPGYANDDDNVDLFAMSGRPETNDYVLYGAGDGTFTADTEAYPTAIRGGEGFDATWFDHKGDGDLDLYVANDMGPAYGGNELVCNDAGVLVDVGEGSGCVFSRSAMGVDSDDFDGDGIPDLYVTETGTSSLLLGEAGGTCVDITQAVGLPHMPNIEMGWGAIFLDIENDGDLDLFEARGDLYHDVSETDRIYDTDSRLYIHEDSVLTEQTAAFGMDTLGSFRAVVAFDDNADGVLDVLMTSVVDAPHLFLSDSCTTNSWIEVAAPLGSRVEVQAGGVTQVHWVTSHSGMGGSRPLFVHVGLGEATSVDHVVVTTLHGEQWATSAPITPRRRLWTPEGPDPWLSRP